MKLGEILAKYSRVRLATRQDNAAILAFLKAIPTEAGELAFRFDRDPDYFRYLAYQGHRSFVFIFDNDDGSIGGVASLCVKICYVNGVAQPTLYLSDVRISSHISRLARVQWRPWYSDIVRYSSEVEEFEGAQFLFTLVMDQNESALRAFTGGKMGVTYEALAKCDTVHILGRLPLVAARRAKPKLTANHRVRDARPEDLPRLREFLHNQNATKAFGHHFTRDSWAFDGAEARDELQRRLLEWDGFRLSSFIIVENAAGQIVGCVNPWSYDEGRRLIIERVPRALKLLSRVVGLLRGATVTDRRVLRVLNLTHLEIDVALYSAERGEIFNLLLDAVFAKKPFKRFEIISLADFPSDAFVLNLKGYVLHRTPATIYRVTPKGELSVEQAPKPIRSRVATPAFEVATP
ncbi:MAG: hypothetical protein JST16_12780 [Bdellovibrionales bacterium]|nr:hypothetical protein [Bdellovibrionales bacterium]